MKTDEIYLHHIIDAINKIDQYLLNFDFQHFSENSLIQDAVIREIEIIGEATKNLSKKFVDDNKMIPWKDIAGMRDKLIHNYFGVDLKIIWKTFEQDIPKLKKYIKENFNWD